ncbi:deoxyribose-phosphate aldolase [Rhagoletis pomonella]|uniref:deoxyribose-phosphate aldolase n=1 Tax=Rhagoletis pomonella TaxID=28610 RepID=UPI00177ACAD7|nr:deoxyribose-phosphate aldolase [Rhagoletis pomonella]
MKVNAILPFDESLLDCVISSRQLEQIAAEISKRGSVSGLNRVVWALKALTLTDSTTLGGDDTAANVRSLCQRAAFPIPEHILLQLGVKPTLLPHIHTAAVCVYPARVVDATAKLKQLNKYNVIPIASVATGFPAGQYGLDSRLSEIHFAIESGATEIDIVINRQLALVGDWKGVYNEVCTMRKACGERAHLKTILAIGELGNMENVYKASMACMLAGADFIKTSTGKETVNATLPAGLVMIYAIQEFERRKNILVGLKPAGGVRTVPDAIAWLTLVKETLGARWLQPNLFRFGASGLLDKIVEAVNELVKGQQVADSNSADAKVAAK